MTLNKMSFSSTQHCSVPINSFQFYCHFHSLDFLMSQQNSITETPSQLSTVDEEEGGLSLW